MQRRRDDAVRGREGAGSAASEMGDEPSPTVGDGKDVGRK
jgi:hypothetical protein